MKRLLYTLLLVSLSYLLTSLALWSYNLNYSHDQFKKPLDNYAQNHQTELKEKVFTNLFSKAQECNSLHPNTLKEQCNNEVTLQLAQIIREEELIKEYSGWPDDLFFVKQSGDNFLRLGWGGKTEDISSSVNKTQLKHKPPYVLQVLTKRCRVFDSTLPYLPDCQVFSTLNLDNNQTGYMVRRIGLTEEDEPFLFSFFPIVFIFTLCNSFLYGSLISYDSTFILFGLTPILVPLILALLYNRKFIHSKLSNLSKKLP